MSIRINRDKCISCNKCVNTCPGNLIYLDDNKKAYIKYPEDCWGCTSCLKECNFAAIDFFLGEDIGGLGSVSHTEDKGHILTWKITKNDGEEVIIDINKNNANAY